MFLFSAVGSKVVTFLLLYWRRNKRESGTNALHLDAKKNEVLLQGDSSRF
jgi:hypothetical protein